jgi:hypothetical protein
MMKLTVEASVIGQVKHKVATSQGSLSAENSWGALYVCSAKTPLACSS